MKKFGLSVILMHLLAGGVVYCQSSATYEVYAFRFGKGGFSKASEIAEGGNSKDSVADCMMFWLIRGNGKNIMVDAGFTLNSSNNSDQSWNKENYIRPDSALTRLNMSAADITDIVITHPHWDHIGGIELFPSAQIWMQQDDYVYFTSTAWQKNGINGGFYPQDVKAIVNKNLKGSLTLIKGDSIEIFPGIRVFVGTKHTWESQYLLVNTVTDKVILASDNCWYYYNLEHEISIPSKYTFDMKAYVNQLKRMKRLQPNVSLIIPGHDALVFRHFQPVADDVVRIR